MLGMKNLIKLLSGTFLLAVVFAGCKKDEHRIYFEGATAPVLSASSTAAQVLDRNTPNNVALTLRWTNPDYVFTTGVSSQDVNYILQVDTTGANFGSAKLQEKSIPKELATSLTVKDLNTFFTKMELAPSQTHSIDFRIKATLLNNSLPQYSNVIKIVFTPYLDFVVEPPGTAGAVYADGNLWIVGDAAAGGWNNPLNAPYDVTQKFTKISVTKYEITINFNATGGYKLIQTMGVWGTQYHALDGTAKFSGDFEKRDADPQFPSPGAGLHKVEVNFGTGKYTVTKL